MTGAPHDGCMLSGYRAGLKRAQHRAPSQDALVASLICILLAAEAMPPVTWCYENGVVKPGLGARESCAKLTGRGTR